MAVGPPTSAIKLNGNRPMKWITNTHEDEVEEVISDLLAGNNGRVIVIGNPEPTTTYTKIQLARMGMVGLWETVPAEAASG